MEPTTVTTLVMIAFAAGLIAMTIRAYFGSWETSGSGDRAAEPIPFRSSRSRPRCEQMRRGRSRSTSGASDRLWKP